MTCQEGVLSAPYATYILSNAMFAAELSSHHKKILTKHPSSVLSEDTLESESLAGLKMAIGSLGHVTIARTRAHVTI